RRLSALAKSAPRQRANKRMKVTNVRTFVVDPGGAKEADGAKRTDSQQKATAHDGSNFHATWSTSIVSRLEEFWRGTGEVHVLSMSSSSAVLDGTQRNRVEQGGTTNSAITRR